jgi:hypothetical protein
MKPNDEKRQKNTRADGYAGKNRKRQWEIRPHERKYSLPAPGGAVDLNDETWYFGERQDLAEKYAAIPWTAISGDSIREDEIQFFVNSSTNTKISHKVLPLGRRFDSIAVAGLIPALGNTNTVGSRKLNMPWMIAAEQKVAYMQSKVSGSLPFAAADLVAYWFAAADIFAEIADAERALRIAKTWNVFENISLPRVMCHAVGWNYNEIISNSRVFEGQIQEIIDLANTLLLPKDLAFVERWFFLYSNIFKDSNLPTAKLYAYRKDGFYVFDEELYDTGSACKFDFYASAGYNEAQPTPQNTTRTPKQWFNSMMERIYRLLPGRSTTVVDIMSKLLRAYDMSTFYAYGKVNAAPIDIKFDPEALTAFANMSLTNVCHQNASAEARRGFDLKQDVNNLTLMYAGVLNAPGMAVNNTTLLRAWESHPSVGSLLEMTRLCACVDGTESSNPWMWTGTEIVNRLEIFGGDGSSDASLMPVWYFIRQAATGDEANAQIFFNLMRFAYMPAIYMQFENQWETEGSLAYYVADVDNYAVLSREQLQRIHRFATASLWGVETSYKS